MNLVGTIGTKAVVTTFASQGIEIKHKNAILHRISELWMVTLARIVSMVVREFSDGECAFSMLILNLY